MKSEIHRFKRGVAYSLAFVLLLWSVEAFEQAFSLDLREFGILPRTLKGAVGIITGPLVHGDIFHLISNTFPLIILGVGIFFFYNSIAFEVIFLVYFLTGLWVWVAAREAYHIGASGLVYGLLSFLFFSGIFRRDPRTMAVSLILFFIYGTNMIYGVFPVEEGISWESHLIGALMGLVCAFYFMKVKSSLIPGTLGGRKAEDHFNSTQPGDQYFYSFHPSKKGNSNQEEETKEKISIEVDRDDLI